MRIGIDIRELQKDLVTGIGQYLCNFLEFVSTEDQSNEYVLFGNQSTFYQPLGENQKMHIIPEYITMVWDQILLPKALKEEKIDLFFSPYYKAPLFTDVKIITVVHDLIPILFPDRQSIKGLLAKTYCRSFIKKSKNRIEKILTVSAHSQQDLMNICDIEENKIKVIPNAVASHYQCVDQSFKDEMKSFGIQKEFIFFIGQFKPHKNVETLIRAYGLLSEELKARYQLVLGGGKNQYIRKLKKIIKELDLKQNIIFAGFISEKDLPKFYNAASLFVFPSFYEGFGIPPLEAMACGTPVIASNTSSLPEVVGDAGICINPYSVEEFTKAMELVLLDENLQNDLIKKGLERSKQFTIEKFCRSILKVFSEINI
jgi:glycosyltransferase involved in cell wall biosynthesis